MKASTLSFSSSFDNPRFSASTPSSIRSASTLLLLLLYVLWPQSPCLFPTSAAPDRLHCLLLFFLSASTTSALLLLLLLLLLLSLLSLVSSSSLVVVEERADVKTIAKSTRLRARNTHARHCSTRHTMTARFSHAIRRAVPAANNTVCVRSSPCFNSTVTLCTSSLFASSMFFFLVGWNVLFWGLYGCGKRDQPRSLLYLRKCLCLDWAWTWVWTARDKQTSGASSLSLPRHLEWHYKVHCCAA